MLILSLSLVSGCAPAGPLEQPQSAQSLDPLVVVSSAQSSAGSEDSLLPPYLKNLSLCSSTLAVQSARGEVTREDTGITVTLTDFEISRLTDLLLFSDPRAAKEQPGALDIPKPFTLRVVYDNQQDTFAFSDAGIRVNGRNCLPENPEIIGDFYQSLITNNELYALLVRDIYYLRDDLKFTADSVSEISLSRLREDGRAETLTLTGSEVFEKIIKAMGDTVVSRLRQDEPEPQLEEDKIQLCRINLKSGASWSFSSGWPDFEASESTTRYVAVKRETDELFDSLFRADALPVLTARVGQVMIPSVLVGFEYDGYAKELGKLPPAVLADSADVLLDPGQKGDCTLHFAGAGGTELTPAYITATLYREQENGKLDQGTPLAVSRDGLVLPTKKGKYYVLVHARYPEGFTQSMLEYIVAD